MFGFVKYCQLSAKVAAPFYKPISSDWEFFLLPILISVWCYQKYQVWATLNGLQWYLIVLNCIFVATYDVVRLFVCFFAICISPLVRYLLKSFAILLDCCLIIDFLRDFLYILNNSPFIRIVFCKCFLPVCDLLLVCLFSWEMIFHSLRNLTFPVYS